MLSALPLSQRRYIFSLKLKEVISIKNYIIGAPYGAAVGAKVKKLKLTTLDEMLEARRKTGVNFCYMDFTKQIELWRADVLENNGCSAEQLDKLTDDLMNELLTIMNNNKWYYWNANDEMKWYSLTDTYKTKINSLKSELEETKYAKNFMELVAWSNNNGDYCGLQKKYVNQYSN